MCNINNVVGQRATAEVTQTAHAQGPVFNHTIALSEQTPVDLRAISPNKMPYQGITKASKQHSARIGAFNNASNVLNALCGNKIDAQKLLSSALTLDAHLQRLHQVKPQAFANGDEAVLAAYAPAVRNLSNMELASVYQSFLSNDMQTLKDSLIKELYANPQNLAAKESLSQLFHLEALVTCEVSQRIIVDEGLAKADELTSITASHGNILNESENEVQDFIPIQHGKDMSGVNLHMIVNTALKDEKIQAKSEKTITEFTSQRNLESMSAKQFGDILRSKDLTINVDANFLFGFTDGGNSPLKRCDEPWENIFHGAARGTYHKGKEYVDKRDSVERTFFPELGEHTEINPNTRPTYAALNVLGAVCGDALSYGSVALHLKPEVNRRSLYAIDDSFYAIKLKFKPEAQNSLTKMFKSDPRLSADFRQKFRDDASLQQEFAELFESFRTAENFNGYLVNEKLPGAIAPEDQQIVISLIFSVFGDKSASVASRVSYDHIENLLPNLSNMSTMNLINSRLNREDGAAAILSECHYIEAYVQGPLLLNRDVAEIAIDEDCLYFMTPEQKTYVDAAILALEGKKILSRLLTKLSTEQQADLAQIAAAFKDSGLKVTIQNKVIDIEKRNEVTSEQQQFYAQHLSHNLIDSIAQEVRSQGEHLANFIIDKLSYNNKNIADTCKRNPQFVLDEAQFLENFESELLNLKQNPPNNSTEQSVVNKAIVNAALKLIGQSRMDALHSLEKLALSEERKSLWERLIFSPDFVLPKGSFEAVVQVDSELKESLKTNFNKDAKNPANSITTELAKAVNRLGQSLASLPSIQTGKRELNAVQTLIKAICQDQSLDPNLIEGLKQSLFSHDLILAEGLLNRLCDPFIGLDPNLEVLDGPKLQKELWPRLRAELSLPKAELNAFTQSLHLLSGDEHRALASICPELDLRLKEAYPPYPLFPKAAHPESLPKNPVDFKKFLFALLPTYYQNEAAFDLRTGYHGRGHICRAFIFAVAAAQIMQELGHDINQAALLCGIIGHDSGRTQNGSDNDNMETKSFEKTLNLMHSLYGNDSLGQAYEDELKNSIVGHAGHTLESALLASADSLDIGRVASYDFKYLPMLRGGEMQGDKLRCVHYEKLRHDLQAECDLLARLTDPITSVRDLNVALLSDLGSDDAEIEMNLTKIQNNNKQAGDEVEQLHNDIPNNEAFFARFEQQIKDNSALFPLLTKYYLKPFGNSQP